MPRSTVEGILWGEAAFSYSGLQNGSGQVHGRDQAIHDMR